MEKDGGVAALRALWQGRAPDTSGHPLGIDGQAVEDRWRAYLRTASPAQLDTARLRREGC